ncbi:unnamed protein product [Paramecium octaurelia]|uniref:Uncharacterized protein n=1 Tax=Paramecium octaurelia TaxID=43137 RepID=A0A8S1SE76_PAROT|nr:unnamed protein product [Paramecium octaurelia]
MAIRNGEHLVISEILPNDQYSFLLTNKNELYLLVLSELIIKKLDIRLKIHNVTQNDTHLFCLTELQQFIKIDKANLYQNEQIEMKALYEQIRYDNAEKAFHSAILPQNIQKFTLNSIQGFVVDRARFIDGTQKKGISSSIQVYQQQYSISEVHQQETQLKLSIINHQVNHTPNKVAIPLQKSRIYYSPQPIVLKSHKSAMTPLKQSAVLPKSYLSRTPSMQQPLARSFVNYSESRTKSPVKKANLMRLLIQDIQITINSMYSYPQIAFEFRERVYSNRSNSAQDIRQMIKEINPRSNSSEKEKIQEFIHKERRYDQELNKQMETVRSQLEGLKRQSNQSEEVFEDAISKRRQSIADDLSVGETGTQDKEINYGQSRIVGQNKYSKNILNASPILNSPSIQKFDETTKFFEEEILIRNRQKQDRVLIREVILLDSSTYVNDENLYTVRSKNQILIASRVINGIIDQSWELTSNNRYKKTISVNEPIQYLEEDIKIYQGNCILRKQIRKTPEILIMGEGINEEQQNGDIVESRRLVENNESLTQMKADGWSFENMQRLERNLGIEQIQIHQMECSQQILEKNGSFQKIQKQVEFSNDQSEIHGKQVQEEILRFNKDTGKIEKILIRKPYTEKDDELDKDYSQKGVKVLSRKILDNSPSQKIMLQGGWQLTQEGFLQKIISESEPEQFVEEEIIIYNQVTKKQDRKLVRRPFFDGELQEISENLDEDSNFGVKVVARRIIEKNEQKQQGKEWQKNLEGNYELQISQAESTQYVEEEILIKDKNGRMIRKLVRRPIEQCKGKVGNNLREKDKNGNVVLSRKIIDNKFSIQDWKKNGKIYEKIISQEEPEQFVEEEIIIINPKTGKQERKLIRRPYENEEEIGDQLNESIGNNQKVVSRRIVQNDSSLSEWKKNQKTGQLEKLIVQNEPAKFIEEEVLVMNEKTGKMERKLVRKQYQPGQNVGNNLQETDSNGNKILARRVIENTSSTQQVEKEGWKNNQGNYEITLSIQEPTQFIEEEIIIMRQGGKQERKIIRRPLDEDGNIEEGEELLEDLGDGCYVVSRKIVDNDLSLTSSKWKKNSDGNYEQSLGVEPSQYITEEVLSLNNETGMMERKLVRKPYSGGKIQEGDQLNEVDKNGNKVLSRKIESNLQPKAAKQQWQNVGKQEEIIINSEEPEQYIEEEIIQINPKTGKIERKIVRKPMNNEELDNLQLGQNLQEDLGNGKQVISRKIVQNDQSNQALKQQGWVKNSDGNMEIRFQPEPVKYVEEEILVQGEDGVVQRKLIRRPYLPQDNKLQIGAVIEKDQKGNKVVSRKIVQNNQPIDSNWVQLSNGQQEKVISVQEPEAYIEEEIIVINPKTQKQERKLIRRPLTESEIGEIGENLQEGDGTRKVVARRIISNEQPMDQMKDWQKKQGQLEIQLAQSEPTKYVEEEVLCYGENGLQRKLIRRPLTKENSEIGSNLNEVDKDGNRILSRKIVDNTQSFSQVQKDWQKGQNGTLEKIISQEEPEQFIEEEILIINPKTGKQERKLIRRPYENEEEIGDQLNESIGNNQKVVSRRIVQNDSSLSEWKKNQKTGQLEKLIVQNEPAKFIEEEVLVMNEKTGKMERKLVRKQYQPGQNVGNNLQETDSNGNKILARRVIENTSSTQQVEKEGWKNNQGNYEITLSIQEPTQFIEEEIIIMRQGGKQERKIIRRPLDNDGNIEEGEELLEDLGDGCYVVSRKIVDNDLSLTSSKWKKNSDGNYEQSLGVEPSQYITEEVLSLNNETGMMERKLVRKPYSGGKIQEGDQLNEVDKNGNKVLSRKIESNLQPKAAKQQWQNVGKQEEIIINSKEPEQYIEEEIIQINPKTGKIERKIVRKPMNNEELDNLQLGQNLQEDLGNGKQVISRKIVQNDQSNQALKQQGWVKNSDGNMEIRFQPEPVKYVEEEILVQGEDGVVQRKLIRRPYLPQDNKLQTGAVIEKDQKGNKVVSRKIVQNNQPIDSNWVQLSNGQQEKVISVQEPEAYIEEEIIVINPKTQKQERKLIRRPLTESEIGEIGENLQEGDGTRKVVARRIISNEQPMDQMKDWQKKQGQLEIQLAQSEPTKYVEEEVLCYGENGLQRKLIRRPLTKENSEIGSNLNEVDKDGNRILSRKIVDNTQSFSQVQKDWQKGQNGTLEKIISQEEPEQFIEEEILIINPKTGKQERKLIRRPYENEEEIGDQLNESIGNNQKVVSRRIVQNDSSLSEWKKNQKTGQLEKLIVQNEPAKFIEEEVLVMNEKTGKMERKLVRKQYQPGQNVGNNLQETDSNGNKILARRVIENTSSTQQVEKEGWKNNQGNYEITLSIQEPTQFIEEEIIIMRQGGKQERKIIRRPLDNDGNIEEGEELLEDLGDGCYVVSRKIVDNDLSLTSSKWKKNSDGNYEQSLGVEPSQYITEEVLSLNNETGMMERKLVRKPYSGGKIQEGDQLNEVDKNGNKVLSRKIESNLQPKAAKQQWQNVGKQEEIIINSEEPEQYIEEEIIQINPKTGKIERKIVRKPMNNEELDNLQLGQNLQEDLGNGKQVISRKIVQNDQSNQALKQQGWVKNSDGNMEIRFQPEPVKYVEEEILVQGEDGVVQRKLIRRPYLPQDNKLQIGAVIEKDQKGNKVVSRKIVQNNQPIDSNWVQLSNGQQEKVISVQEPEAYIEEEIIVINPRTQKQERKLIRRPLTESEIGEIGENLQEGDGTRKVVARRIISNEQPMDQMKDWQQKQGQMEIQLAQSEPTKYVEEEVLCYGENGLQRKLIRRPLTKENSEMGSNLNEVDKDGNRILSRKIVDNTQSLSQVQKDWQKGQNGTLEKIISQEEPEQFIEEEILIINPKTGKQERKLIRRPYENEEEIGDQLNESIGNNQKVVSRRIVQNDSSLSEWKKNQKTGQLEKLIIQNEPAKFIEEEVLVMNEKTGKMERKLNVGNNLQETDSNGNKILARRVIENTSSTQQVEKEGWKNNQGNYEITLSIQEPTQFIEEEIIIMRQGGKQERKIIRRPLDNDGNILEGEEILEDLGDGCYVVSRKIVDNDLSLTSSKWKKNSDGNYEQSLGVEPSQYITEEVLSLNNETGMMERKLVRKPYSGGKIQEGDQLNEVDKNGNKVLSRKIESNLQPKAAKQQWQNVGKQEEIIINSKEPEQYIEEEIIQINPKTGKIERKIVRKPMNNEELDNLQMGQNLQEDLGNGKQVISRKIVQNDQSNQALKQQGWVKNSDGNMEIRFQPEPVKYVEEEILVQGEDGVVQRKLIRRPYLPQDNKLQIGAVIEKDQKGNKVVSRKIVQNNQPIDSNWVQLSNGQQEKVISVQEPEAYVEEEIIVINPRTQKQERKLIRRPLTESEIGEIGENLQEGDGTRKVVARRIISNEQPMDQMKDWQQKQGQMEIQLAQSEPTKYVEEEVLCYGENGLQRKLIRRPLTKENSEMGSNLNEVDKDGNRILSRKIVDNSQSLSQVQKDWQKGQNGTLEKIISQGEPEQFVEEEIIIINPKTGKQERKLIRRPYENEEEIGDQLNESIGNNQKVVSRRIVQNDSSLSEWKKNQKTGQLEKLIIQNEPAKFIEEEVLVMNEKTGKMERKLVRKQYQPGQNVGNNLQETDSNGNKILARRVIENTSSTQQVEKEGWKNNQGNYEITLSIQEPTQFIEEEIIIMRQGGKQERKIIRRPLDNDGNILEGEEILEDLGDGCYVVSRKIVDNDLSLTSSKWKKNSDGNYEQSLGVEPSQYITEEVLSLNNETGMMERKLVRKPYSGGKIQEGDQLNEVDKNGNKVLSRKIESNLQPKAAKQQWQNVGKQEEIIINSEEPEQYIEEEIIQINPKTGKIERKIVRKPLNNEEFDNLQMGQNLQEDLGNGKQVISRKIVQNDQSNQALKQQGWVKNSDGNMEIRFQPEPVKYVEEEILVQGEDGVVQRKLIRRPYLPQDNKLQTGAVIEKDQKGNKVVSRKIVQNNQPIDSNWVQLSNGQQEKVISVQEPEAYVEEEIIVINPRTQKQERKLIRRPLTESEIGEIGENLQEGDGTRKVVARRIISNEQPMDQMKDWQQKQGQMEIQLAQSEPTKYVEEEVLCYGENGLQRKLIRRPLTKENSEMGSNLNEVDKDGNRILSRKIVDNSQSLSQVQKDWQKGQNGTLEKIISQGEPEQFVEEEIIIINPKTGKQERKLIRRPYENEEEIGDQLNESIGNNQKVVSRRIVQNDSSLSEWKKNQKTGQLEKLIIQNEPAKFIEEEVLVMNEKTGKMERKLVRKQYQPGQNVGNNLQETDSNGNKILARRVIENTSSTQQVEKEGWKNNQGNYEITLSIQEPTQFIEEEIIIMRQGGKQERKIIRRPLDNDGNILEGEEILEDLGDGCYVVSRKIVDNDLSLTSSKWKKNSDGNYEQSLGVEPSQYITEEVLSLNNETGMMERKLVRKPYSGGKIQEGDQLNEVDKNGNKVLSRKIESNLQPKAAKQQWQNVGKQEEIIINSKEPEQYIEEEIIQINPKTGKIERKIVRKPMNNEELDNLQMGQNLQEDLGNGKQVISRKIVQNDQSNQALKQQGWVKNSDGNMEIRFQPEPVKYVEEEILVQGEDGVVQRKLIRRPYLPQDNKLQIGAVIEKDQKGNKVVSRKIVQNNQPIDSNWVQLSNGQQEKVISVQEPEAYVEEEIIVINPRTQKQERKLIRRPLTESEIGEIGENLQEGDGTRKVVARRIISNEQPMDQMKDWQQKQGQMEIQLAQSEPTKYVEEEVLCYGENGLQRKLIRRPLTKENSEMGSNLNEVDKDGNRILSRKIVDNSQSLSQVQKDWQKGQNGTLEKIISQGEPEQFVEEEIIIINPKTGKQERKLIRRPYENEEEIGDQLNESIGNNQKVVSRRIVQNDSSLSEWKKNQKTGQLEKLIIQNEPAKFIEEEVLVMNEKTGKMERKLVRKQYQPGQNVGNNLQETDSNGNKILARRVIENTSSTQQVEKEGWKNNQGNYEITLSIQEPTQFIEEEIIIMRQGGKQERKIIRRPLDNDGNILEGEEILEDLGDGCYVVSRKIVDNDLSLTSSKWKKNSDGNYEQSLGVEPSQYITEEVLSLNNETGMMERKLVRKPYLGGKIQEGDQLNEVDKNGNKVLSRKIESNLQPKAAKQQWQNVGKQEEIIINSKEPEQYIEEEIIQINPKTGKIERKIVRKPMNNEELDNLQMGQNLQEDLGNGKQVISRKIVQNDQSNQALKQQGWVKNSDGNMEIRFQPEPVKYVEEEILVQGEDGVVQRKLIRRPYLPQDNKLQTGAVIEKDQKGNKVVSRKIVQNNQPIDSNWVQLSNGQQEKVISVQEPEAFIEEEIIVINPRTQKQERKLIRRPLTESEIGEIGENLQEGDGTRKVVARRIISNEQPMDQMKDWQQKQGQLEIQLAQSEPTKYVEEEVLCYGENGLQRKLIRRPLTKENSEIGSNLNEVDKDGNRILSRKIVDNTQSLSQVQKDWQKGQNGTLEKIISQEEPEQFVEEEILIINPQTGKQERKLIRQPVYQINEQITYGDRLNEQGKDGEIVISRRIIQNQFSSDNLNQQGWQQKKDGNLEQIISEAEPTKYIEEEILVMNPQTQQLERKLIRRPLSPNSQNLKTGDNLTEIDKEGKYILSRKIIDNISPIKQQQKDGWKFEQGKLTRLVSFSEPKQFIEEEILIINQTTGKQERKLIRKPYIEDNKTLFGDELDEQQQGYKVVSRKIVPNNISSETKKKEGWITNKEGLMEKVIASSEPSKYIEEEILSFNKETGQLERKLIRRQIQDNLVMGDSIQEVDPLGNTILSRKIVDNNSTTGWIKQKNGTLVKQLSVQEPEQYIEEEVLLTDKDGQQKLIVERRPFINGEGKINRTDGGFVLSRKVIQNNQTLTALKQEGWVKDNQGILKKVGDQSTGNSALAQQLINQDSQYFEEEHQILNPKTNEMEIIQLKFPYNVKRQIGKRLKEQDSEGNQIISRRIVTNLDLDYNPYQFVEEIVEITNQKSGQTELFAIQKQVNITEVQIGRNLNEKQPNGFIIRQRKVINQFQIDSLSSWKKVTDAPKEYFKQHANINIKRQMYQIDEDSQEQRDSQYRSNEELNSQGIRVPDFDGSRTDKFLASSSEKRNQQQLKTIEEEILILNPQTKKVERRLQRKTNEAEQNPEIGDDLYEQEEDIVILSRQFVESNSPSDLMKKGWCEKSSNIWQRILSKNESFQMIEEVVKEGKGNKQKIIITRKNYKDEELVFGEDLKEQLGQDQTLVRRIKVSNRSLAFYKNCDFSKNREGNYVKIIQANDNPNVQLKIPKYQEPNLKKSKSSSSQLSLIQAIEQTQITKSKSLINVSDQYNKTQGTNKGQQQLHEQFMDDQAIINRTNISDISETDKMFLKQLERKDHSKKQSQQDILRNRVGSDKNNRSSSSPFSDQDYNMSSNSVIGIKIIKRLLQKMILVKVKIGFDEICHKNQQYERFSKAIRLIKKFGTRCGFASLNEHRLKTFIEFNEDDIIKYNQMLTENKIQAMEHIPEQGQQAEPIELSPDEKGSRTLVKSQSQILPKQLNFRNSFTSTPQKEQQQLSQNQIKSGQPVRAAQAPSTSIIISSLPQSQQLARGSNSRSSTIKTVVSPQPQQTKYVAQQKFSYQSEDKKKSGQNTNQSTQKSNRQQEVPSVNQSQNASQSSIQNSSNQLAAQKKDKIQQQFKKMGSYSQKSKK